MEIKLIFFFFKKKKKKKITLCLAKFSFVTCQEAALLFHLPFSLFLVVLYAILLINIALFIKKHFLYKNVQSYCIYVHCRILSYFD
jgi:hypothetical protein